MEKEDDGAPPPPPPLDDVEGEYEDEEMIDYGDDDDDEFPYPTLPPTPPLPSSSSPDIKTDDAHQLVHNEKCLPQSQVHPAPEQRLDTSDINENQQDSDDDGPPPGWESKCQLEPELQTACPTTRQSDIITDDVPEDTQNDEDQPQSQGHPNPAPERAPSDTEVEQHESDDDGPPPGWDPRWQSEPKLQLACPKTSQLDMEMNDGQQDAENEDGLQPKSNALSSQVPEMVSSATEKTEILEDLQDSEDEGPPPGWDYKCQPESMLQMAHLTIPQTDSKMEDVQQDTHKCQNRDNSQPQSHTYISPAPELVSLDMKVKEQDSEDSGPKPVHPKSEPEPELHIACPTPPQMEDDKQDVHGGEVPPPGWESTPQRQSKIPSNSPSPMVPSGMGRDHKYVNIIEESSKPPSRQGSVPPTKPQISMPKPLSTINHHEMGQMVCGSCRRLLSYPKGARYVECACCLEENYVLEEHEVGQLICGSCKVLLMYPYGAPKVRCANCSSETEIGDQNRRLPLSEHKRRARQHLKRVQAR